MDAHEMILRQSLMVLQATIDDLCKRRDQIAAQLPNAPKLVMPKSIGGMEIKPGAWMGIPMKTASGTAAKAAAVPL